MQQNIQETRWLLTLGEFFCAHVNDFATMLVEMNMRPNFKETKCSSCDLHHHLMQQSKCCTQSSRNKKLWAVSKNEELQCFVNDASRTQHLPIKRNMASMLLSWHCYKTVHLGHQMANHWQKIKRIQSVFTTPMLLSCRKCTTANTTMTSQFLFTFSKRWPQRKPKCFPKSNPFMMFSMRTECCCLVLLLHPGSSSSAVCHFKVNQTKKQEPTGQPDQKTGTHTLHFAPSLRWSSKTKSTKKMDVFSLGNKGELLSHHCQH